MKIKRHEVDGIVVFEVSGEMYGGPDNMMLIDEVTKLIEEKKFDLVIDLSKVKWISSTGLGILVSARSRYAKEGGVVKLCNPNDRILGILQVTRLNLIFDVYPSVNEAVESFKQ